MKCAFERHVWVNTNYRQGIEKRKSNRNYQFLIRVKSCQRPDSIVSFFYLLCKDFFFICGTPQKFVQIVLLDLQMPRAWEIQIVFGTFVAREEKERRGVEV